MSQEKCNKPNLVDKLLDAIDAKRTPCIVGLDPVLESIPTHLIQMDDSNPFKSVAHAFLEFNKQIIDAIYDLVPGVKPQIAFYEKYGAPGLQAFQDTVRYAQSKGLIVIEDGKRGDIGSTSQEYANGHLGVVQVHGCQYPSLDVDLLTVNPYLGSDTINPFLEVCKVHGKGIFILVKTSNPSSSDLQDRLIQITPGEKEMFANLGIDLPSLQTEVYNLEALKVNIYAKTSGLVGKRGYSSIGAVVGATYPKEAEVLRKIMPNSIFLVPGYGAQGGKAIDLTACFNDDGYGAVVNNSRGIIYAHKRFNEPERFAEHTRHATLEMIKDVNTALKACGKYPISWSRK